MIKIFTTIALLFLLNNTITAQASNIVSRRKFEVSLNYAIQRPFYSVTTLDDIGAVSHHQRYRSRIGADLKYYVFNHWFFDFQTAVSQEGGGFKQQHTNANYWKNGFYFGFSTNQNRSVIFDIYSGIDFNLLINAKFKNTVTDVSENVSDYYNRFVISFPVLGAGLKTKIDDNLFLRIGTYFSMTNYRISQEENINVSQLIFPAFQISLTKYIK